jgi:hypothetical protein
MFVIITVPISVYEVRSSAVCALSRMEPARGINMLQGRCCIRTALHGPCSSHGISV